MGGGKETPRQKMIGMMYLVLTALLAMNVSKQILHGYVSVNESIEKTKESLEVNNERVFKSFEEMAGITPAAKPYLERAIEAQKEIMIVYKHIDVLRTKIIEVCEKPENPKSADTMQLAVLEHVGQIDNYDMPTNQLIGPEAKTPKTGELTASDLKAKLNGLYSKLVGILDAMQKDDKAKLPKSDYEGLKKKIGSIKPDDKPIVEDGIEMGWEAQNFYHLPEAAVVTTLNMFQANLKNVEADILQVFSGASGKLAIKFDHLEAKVIAPSSYIQAGQPYTADIFLAASSSKLGKGDLEFLIGIDSAAAAKGERGTVLDKIENGMGKYSATQGIGDQTVKGVIKFKKPDGNFDYYNFESSYTVAAPAVAVSADQMNVFYAGVENPVTVSAAGVAPGNLIVNPSGSGVSKTGGAGGKFMFKFTSPGECVIAVSAKTADGTKPQGTVKFRVKALPPPVASVGGKSGYVDMPKAGLAAIGGMGANAPGFDFKANYVVLSFDVTGTIKGQTKFTSCQGNNMNADAKAILAGAGPGAKIFFDNIRVKKPDGVIVSGVPGVTIKVK
jgi:gliding motility-associated protein GldM